MQIALIMSLRIAPTAIVDSSAELDDDVEIGHYCVIGPKVAIGRGTRLQNNVTIAGRTAIGRFNHIFPYAVIGNEPQDLSYRGSDTEVVIGADLLGLFPVYYASAGDVLVAGSSAAPFRIRSPKSRAAAITCRALTRCAYSPPVTRLACVCASSGAMAAGLKCRA